MTLLSVNTTEHERPIYIGMTGLTWGLGTVLGPVSRDETLPSLSALIPLAFQIIGGAFGDSSATWRFAFYINRESFLYLALSLCNCSAPLKFSLAHSVPQCTF